MATPKKDPKDYLKLGRKTVYKPEYAQIALERLYTGMSKIQLCREFFISKDTMQEWEKRYPDFSAAVQHGVDYAEGYWIGMGHDNLNNKDFNSRLYELNMMNRFGWNKKSDNKQEVNVKVHEESLKELK